MGATTSFNHPWPAGTDLVSQGDDVIKSLAEDVEQTEKDLAGAYRTILTGRAGSNGALSASAKMFVEGGTFVGDTTTGQTTQLPPVLFYFDDADYAVAGLTLKMRLRAQCLTNNTAPATTLTVDLRAVTASVGSGTTGSYTLGSVVSGSPVAFASPSASSRNQAASSDFTVPADGYYALCASVSGAQATNSFVTLFGQLQVHNV
jgi:hypothetical protein